MSEERSDRGTDGGKVNFEGERSSRTLQCAMDRRRFLRAGVAAGVGASVGLGSPHVESVTSANELSPQPLTGELVPESTAVYLPTIPPDFYPRQFLLTPGNCRFDGVVTVRVQPPAHLENPYPYGPLGQYSLYYDAEADLFTVVFGAEGIFHTIVDDGFETTITTTFVGVSIEEIKGKAGKTGCTETFTVSDSDLVISDKKDTYAERWDYYQDDLGQAMVEVSDVDDAVDKIDDHVDNNGKLGKLTIACHAAAGLISIGGGSGPNGDQSVGKDAANSQRGDYQSLVDGLKGKFKDDAELCLIGCYVGEGTEGQNLVDCLAADIGGGIRVKAKKGAVSYPLRWYLLDRYASSSGEKGFAESS